MTHMTDALDTLRRMTAERDALAAENASPRAALEPLKALLQPGLAPGELVGVYLRGDALNAIHDALSTPPSAAVERVRLMGAVVDAAKNLAKVLAEFGLEPQYVDSAWVDALDAALAALEANGTHDAAPLRQRLETLAGEWEESLVLTGPRHSDAVRAEAYSACARQLRSALKGEG